MFPLAQKYLIEEEIAMALLLLTAVLLLCHDSIRYDIPLKKTMIP